jgi:ribosomal protein S18 acetylase RimI-like enzyme
MTKILKATLEDFKQIANIGRVGVEEAHRESCSVDNMNEFLKETYSDSEIKKELSEVNNIYHVINFKESVVGFSKIIFNAIHSNIEQRNVSKLDRIYLLKEFHDLKLGFELLRFNIDLAKKNSQSGIWLFTWVGNKRAVDFYLKTGFSIIGSHKFKVTETHFNEHHQMYLDISNA